MPRQSVVLKYGRQLLIAMGFMLVFTTSLAGSWRTIAPGIEYQDLGASLLTPWSHIHVFRIDLNQNQFKLITADNLSKSHASINEFARYSKALLTINGGFFDHKYRPLGLRISQKKQKNPLKRISWWGIFYTKNQKAYLSSLRHFHKDRQIDFALQSGPRLLVDGKVSSLKPGVAERSALGITENEKVIVLATDNNPMTTTALANLMKSNPLNCLNALNLDGGSSTQLNANTDAFQLRVHGLANISDAIVVTTREQD